jgi:hypothetical protein
MLSQIHLHPDQMRKMRTSLLRLGKQLRWVLKLVRFVDV